MIGLIHAVQQGMAGEYDAVQADGSHRRGRSPQAGCQSQEVTALPGVYVSVGAVHHRTAPRRQGCLCCRQALLPAAPPAASYCFLWISRKEGSSRECKGITISRASKGGYCMRLRLS